MFLAELWGGSGLVGVRYVHLARRFPVFMCGGMALGIGFDNETNGECV
ncbi:hypothetical protein C8K36_101758 [Rhodococcus sp. OK519]|nr:hypothetical protein C8K36_101758 [Rhodococcus sp. OK519]